MLRHQPTLKTERLRLRPFVAEDAAVLSGLVVTRELNEAALILPRVYSVSVAKTWIASLAHLFRGGSAVHFALSLQESQELIGGAALRDIDEDNRLGEMEIWLGAPWWRQGYASEAARAVLNFGFGTLSLHRISARSLARNEAAGAFLEGLGMRQEGRMREAVRREGRFEDVLMHAVLAEEAQMER